MEQHWPETRHPIEIACGLDPRGDNLSKEAAACIRKLHDELTDISNKYNRVCATLREIAIKAITEK